jgi:uncharacterized protein (TIGR03437 family)
VAIDSAGRIHVVSDETYSLIDPGDTRMSIACVLNGASFLTGGILPAVGIAPGEIVSLFGSALGPDQPAGPEFDANGNVSNSVAGVQVLFDGQAAPLLYVQAKQINAVVPFEIAGTTTTHIEVEYRGNGTPAIEMAVNEAVPGVFTLDSSGYGPAAVLNEDGTINSPSNPAKKGSVIMIYATGAGLTNPSAVDGKLAIGELPKPRLPVSVRFTEPIDADIVYAGAAPGFVAGAVQINARIPFQTHSGTGVPITLIIGQAVSEGFATIAVE